LSEMRVNEEEGFYRGYMGVGMGYNFIFKVGQRSSFFCAHTMAQKIAVVGESEGATRHPLFGPQRLFFEPLRV